MDKLKLRHFIRRWVLRAKWATDAWVISEEMHDAVDNEEYSKALTLLDAKRKEWPQDDPELVRYGVGIAFFREEEEGTPDA